MTIQAFALLSGVVGVAGAVADSGAATAAGVFSLVGLQIWAMGQFSEIRERLARLEGRR